MNPQAFESELNVAGSQAVENAHVIVETDFHEWLEFRYRLILMVALAVCAYLIASIIRYHSVLYLTVLIAILLQLRTSWVVFGFTNIFIFCIFRYSDPMLSRQPRFFFDLAFVFLIISYLSLSCRYAQTCKYAFAYDIDHRSQRQTPWSRFSMRPIVSSGWYFGLVAMVCSAAMLVINYKDPNAPRLYGLEPVWSRLAFFAFAIFFGWYLLRMVFGVFGRWQQFGGVAEVEARALANSEMFSDLAGVERRRARLAKKEAAPS